MGNITINGESLGASLQNSLAVEQFLSDNYQFRRNVLNGKVEYRTISAEQADYQQVWRALTPEAVNSIVRKAKQENITKNSPWTICLNGTGRIIYPRCSVDCLVSAASSWTSW